jgi:RimJ/RimL family protein N-acetyltransferase
VLEGTLRQYAWVDGSFADGVILSRLATERLTT